jgi:hypothetical protein
LRFPRDDRERGDLACVDRAARACGSASLAACDGVQSSAGGLANAATGDRTA